MSTFTALVVVWSLSLGFPGSVPSRLVSTLFGSSGGGLAALAAGSEEDPGAPGATGSGSGGQTPSSGGTGSGEEGGEGDHGPGLDPFG